MLSLIVFIVMLAAAASQKPVYSENKTLHNGKTILLGGLFPLSENINGECGHIRPSSFAAMEAMVFTIRRINADSTLLPGINLTYDIRDTCSIPNKGLEQSLSYVHNPSLQAANSLAVSGIVGAGFFSEVSRAVASLFRLFQIPQISYASSSTALSDRVQYDYFFRTLPADSYLARAMADTVIHFRWSYIIALHADDYFGTSGMDIILKNIQKSGNTTCIAVKISIAVGNDSAALFDGIVSQMNQPWVRNASVALLYGYKRQTMGIMAAIERLMVRDPNTPLQFLTWVGCEALRVDSKYHYLLHGMIRMQISVKGSQEFQDHFTSLTDASATDETLFREYWEYSNNCSFNAGTCNYTSRPQYLQKNEISSIVDAVYAFAHTTHGLIQTNCNNSDLCSNILVRRFAGMAINGSLIRDYLLHNLSFPGLTSNRVTFNANGNDQSFYSIKNLQKQLDGTYAYHAIGTWTTNNLLDITERVEWNREESGVPQSICSQPCGSGQYRVSMLNQGKCCWACSDCPGDNTVSKGLACSKCTLGYAPNRNRSMCIKNNVTYLTWSSPWAVIILLFTCAGLICTISTMTIYIVYHNHTVVKSSSRELSAMLLIGLFLCYILPFFFLSQPSPAICAIRRFSVGFSFALCFSALLVKTNRLHRIFNKSPDQLKTVPKFISPKSQVVIVLILLLIQVAIATIWLAVQHPGVKHVFRGKTTELQCSASSDVGLIVSLGYNLLLLILSTYFAFLARKIPENFNEAKFINVTLYTIIIIWLAFIPTYLATANLNSIYQTSSLIIAIVLTTTTTLMCLFAPKIYLILRHQIKQAKETKPVTSTNGVTTTNVFTSKSSNDFSTVISAHK